MRKLLLALAAIPALANAQTPPYPGAPPTQPPATAVPGTPAAPPGAAAVPAPVPPQRPGRAAAARARQQQAGAAAQAPTAPQAAPTPTPSTARGAAAGAVSTPGGASAPTAAGKPAPDAEAGAAGGTARMDGKCTPMQGRFLLAFNKADIVDVLEQASRWTCRNFAYTEDIARGKITLLSKTAVTAEEAYSAFLAALTANNIAIYPTGRYYKLVRIADAKKHPIPTLLDDGTEVPANEQPVTKLFRLHYGDPDQLRGIMANFTSPQGADIQSIPPDVLVITDIGLNIRRIERMLEELDRPGSGELIHFIQVRYASARDLADKVNQVFQASPAQPGKPGRRSVIGGVAPAPGAPAGAVAPIAAGEEREAISISKVLADERTNKLVVIADEKSFQRIADLVRQLDVPTAGEGQIHVVFMRYASAEDLAQTLQALASGQASTRRPAGATGAPTPAQPYQPPPQAGGLAGAGTTASLFAGEVKITADKVSNALIVLASASDFASVERLVEKLDRQRRQVFVEAVIMEVDLNDDKRLGVGMHTAIPVQSSDGTGFIPLASEPGQVSSLNLQQVIGLGGFLTGMVGPVNPQLQSVLPISSLSILIQALQSSSNVNVLSTPHILASDNEDAEITVGQNVPFQAGYAPGGSQALTTATTGSTTAASSLAGYGALLGGLGSLYAPIQRQNVELRLKIKPQITEGDNVRLQIDEQTEEIVSKDPVLGPTTAKRTAKTSISVKDQTTIVIGGLIQERAVESVKKIPLLGDIPVLGWLFRDNEVTKTKTNLLLFLTPYIIRDQNDYRRIYERKRQEQQEFVEQFYGAQPQYQVAVDYTHKTGPYTKVRKEIELESMKLENGGPGAPGEGTVSPSGRGMPPSTGPGMVTPPPAPSTVPQGGAPPGSTAPPTPPSGTSTPPPASSLLPPTRLLPRSLESPGTTGAAGAPPAAGAAPGTQSSQQPREAPGTSP